MRSRAWEESDLRFPTHRAMMGDQIRCTTGEDRSSATCDWLWSVWCIIYIYLSYIQLVLEAKLENGLLMLKCCSYETI